MKKVYLLVVIGSIACAAGVAACDDDDNTTPTEDAGTPSPDTGVPDTDGGTQDPDSGVEGELKVETYTSADAADAMHSYVVTGATSAMVVNTQFFKADAEKLVQLIQSTGKDLKFIVLTHASPDHWMGVKVVKDAFPAAEFVSAVNVAGVYTASAQATFDALKAIYTTQIPDGPIVPITGKEIITQNSSNAPHAFIELDGNKIFLYAQKFSGHAPTSVIVALPDKRVFAGDLVGPKSHLFLGYCQSPGWLSNLGMTAPFSFNTFYPSHGDTPADWQASVPETGKYVTIATSILRDSADFPNANMPDAGAPFDAGSSWDAGETPTAVDVAKAKLQAVFPEHKNPTLLDRSVRAYIEGSAFNGNKKCDFVDAGLN